MLASGIGIVVRTMVFSAAFCNSEEAGVEGTWEASDPKRGRVCILLTQQALSALFF